MPNDNPLDTMSPDAFGRSLKGMGVNILVTDVTRTVAFLTRVFGMTARQPTRDFAIMTYGTHVFLLHADHTYHSHPLLGLLPETPPRSAGIELRLYDSDPDAACDRVGDLGTILQPPADKPHGLREAFIVDHDGYVWVPSRPK